MSDQVFIFQEYAEPIGDPPAPPDPAPDLIAEICLPPTLVDEPSAESSYLDPLAPAVAPGTESDVSQWKPEIEFPTPDHEPNTIEDYVLATFPTLPTPPPFVESWQQKLEPEPDDEPVPYGEGLSIAALSVPAVPVDSWSPDPSEPVLDDLAAFGEGVLSPIPVAPPLMPPEAEGVLPQEDVGILAELTAIQLLEPVQAGDGWLVPGEQPVPEELDVERDQLARAIVEADPIPVSLWMPDHAEPVLDEEPPLETQLAAGMAPVVTIDQWFSECPLPSVAPDQTIVETVQSIEPSLFVMPALDWYQQPAQPDEEQMPPTIVEAVWNAILISPPNSQAFYVDAAGWWEPGSKAAGYAS